MTTSEHYNTLMDFVGRHLNRNKTSLFGGLLSEYAEALSRDVTNEAREAFIADVEIIKDYLPNASSDVNVVLAWVADRATFGFSREGR